MITWALDTRQPALRAGLLGNPRASPVAASQGLDLSQSIHGAGGIGGLKQMATKQRLRGPRARQLSAVIGSFQSNRRFMQYDGYLPAGFPIGSDVAEGACRHLVKDRMELTGMRWSIPGAQAMLDLRAVYLNGDWRHRAGETGPGPAPRQADKKRKHVGGQTGHMG